MLDIQLDVSLEPCDEPLGMESGLIPNSQILAITPGISNKGSVRLNTNVTCSNISSVLIDLGRLMKITGFTFSSDKFTIATIRYGVDSGDVAKLKTTVTNLYSRDWIRVTPNSNLFNFQKRTIQINNGSAKIVIPDVFTLRYIKLMFSNTACIKLEIYGCPEICSSIIPKLNSNSLNLQYSSPVTVSGLVLQPQTTAQNLDVKCFMRNTHTPLINKQIPALSNKNIAVWFDRDYVCDIVQVTMPGLVLAKLSVVGCASGCMEKLIKTVTDEVVSASNYFKSYLPVKSFLNNMESCWASLRPPKRSYWIQVCFKSSVLVSAVALQSQGHWTFQRITSYILSYSYDSNLFHNYAENGVSNKRFQGPDSRFGTKVNRLTTPITAKCFRMRDLICVGNHCITKWEVLGCMKGLLPVITAQAKITFDIKTEYKELTCQVSGQPYAIIYWTLENGTRITNNLHYQVIETQNLSDLSVTYSVKLKILRAISSFITTDSNVNCNINSALNVNCYMSYTCNACYLQSEIVQKITAVTFTGLRGNIGQPTVKLVSVLATSAQLSWTSSIGLFSVVSYHISLTDLVDRQILEETISSTIRKYNNLKPYRNYTFKINAYNRFNIKSNDIMTTFTTQQAEPSAITNFKAVAVSEYEIQLNWSPPNNHNGILSKYFIRHKVHNGVNVNQSTWLLSFRIKHLQAYTTYQISVIATTRNNDLFGPSESKSISTKQGKPSPPQNIKREERKEWSGFSWQAPQKLNGVLQKYKVIIRGTKTYFPSFNYERHFETETRSIEHNIYPGTNYTIRVRAVTGGGEGEVTTSDFETPYANPQKPNITRKETLYDYQVVLFNVQPYTGPISYFEFGITNSTDCFQNKVVIKSFHDGKMISMKKGVKELQVERRSFHLDLVGTYRFCLRAIVNTSTIPLFGEEGEVSIDRKDLRVAQIKIKASEVEITIPESPPSTKYYVIIVFKTHSIQDPNELSVVRGFNESDPSKPYITGVFGGTRESFTVGNGESYNYSPKKRRSIRRMNQYQNRYQNIINVKLQPNEQYDILIRAHEDEENFYSSVVSVKTKSYGSGGASCVNDCDGNDIIIICVCVIVAAVLLFTIVGFIFYRKRGREKQYEKKRILELSPIGINNPISRDDFVEKDESDLVDDAPKAPLFKDPPEVVELNSKHPPVKLNDFSKYWEKLNKDSHHVLSEEYKDLDSDQLHEWTEAVLPELKSKNRYGNIVTYNHSRVKLQGKTLNGLDYINASFIHGYNSKDMYIASQGPKSACLDDLWQMIWEQNISVIVMVTKLIEKNKKKCEQYWPNNGSQKYGSVEVSLNVMDQYADFVVRTFSMTKTGSNDTRIIQQYHFLSWPDHGVPEYPSDLLNFYHKIRKDHPVESVRTPILVHCSAGVGRTGTFICIDNMLKLARDRSMLDVFNYVNFMRSRRIHMVQTEDQYMFIYHALFETLTCGITAIQVSKFTEEIQKLLCPNQNKKKKTGYQLQYELLNVVTKNLAADETTAATKKANKMKHRGNVVAKDIGRVLLTSSIYDNENVEDYINAVYVNGYKRRNAFIATEHPLQGTLYEYWKMILEKNVAVIVMLNSLNENKKNFDKFWPSDKESCDFANIKVTSESERVDEKMTTSNLLITTDNDTKESAQTCIIPYDQWPYNGVPENLNELIKLLTMVEQIQGYHSNRPVVVMCSDGAGRTGTFIAISILLEQLKMEEAVDVFQTVKKIRTIRPEFVSNVDQYQLCYRTIQSYIDSFSTYSNFTD